MKAILIGAGRVAHELLRRMGEAWTEVVVVSASAERLERTKAVRDVATLLGDGSSRVVLERAGLEDADALVALTGDDRVNLEACRLAREEGIVRIAAVLSDPGSATAFQDLGVTAFSPALLVARQLELTLETRRISSTAFAGGLAEVIEAKIEHDSPVRGKSLGELHSSRWLVGAIRRGRRLIIPHGDTVFMEGDLVTVVGAASDFGEIVRTFLSGQARFPLDFGKRVAVALIGRGLDQLADEAVSLVRYTRATELIVVYRDPARGPADAPRIEALLERLPKTADGVEVLRRPVESRPLKALAGVAAEESVGVLVLPAPARHGPIARRRVATAVALGQRLGIPILLSRGTHSYARILVPARKTPAGLAAMRAAIDLAQVGSPSLIGLAVVDPEFIAGEAAVEKATRDLDWLRAEAAVQGVRMEGFLERGNPVKLFASRAAEVDLLVLGVSPRARLLDVKVVHHLATRCRCSVLLVPTLE